MDNELDLWKKYQLHSTAKVVITHSSPGWELLVREDGSFYEDTNISTYDITNMEEAKNAVDEILSTANLREYVRQLEQKEKGLIDEVDSSLLIHFQ